MAKQMYTTQSIPEITITPVEKSPPSSPVSMVTAAAFTTTSRQALFKNKYATDLMAEAAPGAAGARFLGGE